MKMGQRIREHVVEAGKRVYSLRLFNGRSDYADRIRVICFPLKEFKQKELPKLVLPLIEEKLQVVLQPACGRYRG